MIAAPFRRLLLALAACALVPAAAQADPVYGEPADLTGSRDESNMVLGGDYVGDEVSISWLITDNGDGTFHYEYTFSGFGEPDISHFILDLTDDCVGVDGAAADSGCVANVQNAGELEFATFGTHPSNPGFPGGVTITGVKFDSLADGLGVLSFDSNRPPVWGDFYLKGGPDSFAYNTGLEDPTSSDVLDFIARPNGPSEFVPEPGTMLMVGMGLLGLAVTARTRRG